MPSSALYVWEYDPLGIILFFKKTNNTKKTKARGGGGNIIVKFHTNNRTAVPNLLGAGSRSRREVLGTLDVDHGQFLFEWTMAGHTKFIVLSSSEPLLHPARGGTVLNLVHAPVYDSIKFSRY